MQEKILSILSRHGLMTVATNRPDGWPQTTSVSYVHRGLFIYFLIPQQPKVHQPLERRSRLHLYRHGFALAPSVRGSVNVHQSKRNAY